MATKIYASAPLTLTAATHGATLVVLGDADREAVGSWIIELETTGATYSLTPRGRNRGARVDPTTDSPEMPYIDQQEPAGEAVDGRTTPITGTNETDIRMFKIIADGMSVALDFTAFSAGTIVLSATSLQG